jgi:hypothetical protein
VPGLKVKSKNRVAVVKNITEQSPEDMVRQAGLSFHWFRAHAESDSFVSGTNFTGRFMTGAGRRLDLL